MNEQLYGFTPTVVIVDELKEQQDAKVVAYSENSIITAVQSTCVAHKIDLDLAQVLAGGVVSRLREMFPRG